MPFLGTKRTVWLLVGLALGGAVPAAAGETPFKLVASDASGVTIEYAAAAPVVKAVDTPFGVFQSIALPGHSNSGELGGPALPLAGVGIGLPELAEPRLTFEILESHEIAGVRPLPVPEGPTAYPDRVIRKDGMAFDPALYAEGGEPAPEPIVLAEAGHLRNHRIGQVSVRPVRYLPAAGSIRVIDRARIRVDFVSSPKRKAALGGRLVPVGEEKGWEDTYRKVLLNYEAARAFRTRLLPESPAAPRGVIPGTRPLDGRSELHGSAWPGTVGPEYRVFVGLTGLYALSFAELAARGWPADVPLREIHFYEKSFNAASPGEPIRQDRPVWIEEAGLPDSLFNGDDRLYFYGLNFDDRFHPNVADGRYTNLHAYWISRGPEPAARTSVAPGWFEGASFATPVSYIHETHWEENKVYTFGRPELETGISPPPLLPTRSTHYWLERIVFLDSLQFATPGRDPSRPLAIRARWQGYFAGNHFVKAWLTRGCTGAVSDTLVLPQTSFGQAAAYTFDSGFTIPGARLADGCNRFKIQGNGAQNGDPTSPGAGAYFDWFEVDYPRFYVMSGGTLRFTSGDSVGNLEFAVRGLADSAAIVFDVTDSLNPVRLDLSEARYRQLTRPINYEVRFRVNIASQHTYVIFDSGGVPAATQATPVALLPPDLGTSNIQLATGTDVTAIPSADVIALAHPSFGAALLPWKDRREATPYNHRVWIVYPQEVWDYFSGGDKSVPALREWLRYVYRNATTPPDYLLLFGDASEDYRKDLLISDPDWVPTMMEYGPVWTDRYELVGSDSYYVRSLGASDPETDLFPDMHLGRLSVGSAQEAQDIVAKLMAYDTYSPDDAWRNRGVILSDDQYSTQISGLAAYCYWGSDLDFEAGGDSLEAIIGQRSCYTGFELEHMKLRELLNQATCSVTRRDSVECFTNPELDAIRECTARSAMPAWVESASRGQLFEIYSGHGNRAVMTTEYMIRYFGDQPSSANQTPLQLTNYGKPFVYIGVGCHLNEFEFYQERLTLHSLGEVMVMLPGRAAIASIASTGFEWVSTNKPVEIYLGRTLFSDHPLDPVTGRPRRILGEGVDQGLVRLALERGGLSRDRLRTYFLIGDPTLAIDMAPPQFQVQVDGVAVAPGAEIVPAPGASTVHITARLSDDVDYATDGFSITDNGNLVPPSEYTITPVDDDAPGACRGALLDYTATLEAASYPIVLRARDWLGREMAFTLQVPLHVTYQIEGRVLGNDEIVSVDAPLEVHIDSPVDLAAGDIDIRVNGQPGYFTLSGSGRTWTATRSLELPVGTDSLETLVRGIPTGGLRIRAQKGETFSELYFYPSPWEGHGTGKFTYQLSYQAGSRPRRAGVTVFSVAGRKVVSLEGPVETGRNIIEWDMRDQEGDGLANGVYIFKMTLETASGQTVSQTDRLVIHR